MNFVVFPVGATNIFPLANSSAGGQLLSEYNIRSRESVQTDPNVEYFIGPSYTHSMNDFAVYCQRDGHDVTISTTAIQIQPGRALVNGHYVESLTPVVIDINDANTLAQKEGIAPLKGKLAVGLRMAYSTYQTLAGSALVEDTHGEYYEGVQAVVLPADAVKLPTDVPKETQFSKVNMDLLLATFTYRNGTVSDVKQNSEKIRSISADRIANMDNLFSDIFVSKTNLDPNKLYVFSGKSDDGTTIDGRDTWCDATDSLMEWDSHPIINRTAPSAQAAFTYDASTGNTSLVIPHKQVDGMKNTQGQDVYFQDKILPLPLADFSGAGGVVGPEYTRRIKEIEQKVNAYYSLPNGRMRQYIPILNSRDDLPKIPISESIKWPYSQSEFNLEVEQLRALVLELQSQFDALSRSISDTITAQVASGVPIAISANTLIQSIQSDISNINASLQELNSRIGAQEGSSPSGSPSTAEFNELKTRVTELRTQVDTLQSDVETLQQTLPSRISSEVNVQLDSIQRAIQASYDATLANLEAQLKSYIDSVISTELDDRSILAKWTWRPGDYILVGEDRTVVGNISGRYPSTMYIVRPGNVTSISRLDESIRTDIDVTSDNYSELYNKMLHKVPVSLAGGVELDSRVISSAGEAVDTLWNLSMDYKGAPGIDYFVARLREYDESTHTETWKCYFWTPHTLEDTYSYSDPIWITGGVPLATESSIGGFVNVPEDAYGGGYVRMDENGYLKVMDFELLLTGVLSFQLGQDRNEGAGLSMVEIQSVLDDQINDRVCFPNAAQMVSAAESAVDPHVIHLYLTLPEEAGDLVIHDIGSRYGSSLYVHIRGAATSATNITFRNCDKLRIDEDIEGAPTIIIDNVHLFYNSAVLDACKYINNLTLWYQRWSDMDPDLQIDGMTVSVTGPVDSTEDIDPWDSTYANDNHYAYALRSITFGNDGSIINVGMLVGDSTTANIDEGKSVFAAEFILPQGFGLSYPVTKMTHQIKVTGSFVSHYYVTSESAYMMKHTDFTALTQQYDPSTGANVVNGTISFYTDAELVSHISGVTPTTTVDGWDLNTMHYFIGGAIN